MKSNKTILWHTFKAMSRNKIGEGRKANRKMFSVDKEKKNVFWVNGEKNTKSLRRRRK